MGERIIRFVIKTLAILGGVGFLLLPVTKWPGFVVFTASLILLLLCFVVWRLIFPDDEDGYWPDKPNR